MRSTSHIAGASPWPSIAAGSSPGQRPRPGGCLADPTEVERALEHLGEGRPGQDVGPGIEVCVAEARQFRAVGVGAQAVGDRVQRRDHRPERVSNDRITPVEDADPGRSHEHVPAVQVVMLDRGRDPRAFQLSGRGRDPLAPDPASASAQPRPRAGPRRRPDSHHASSSTSRWNVAGSSAGRPSGTPARSSSPARPSTSRCRRAYAARIPSHAPRSRSPSPSGRVCRSVGPPSSNRSHPPIGVRVQREQDVGHVPRREGHEQPHLVGRARPGCFAPHGAAVRRDAQHRRPRPDVRLIDGPDDRVAQRRESIAGPVDDACEPRGVRPVLDPGKRHGDVKNSSIVPAAHDSARHSRPHASWIVCSTL